MKSSKLTIFFALLVSLVSFEVYAQEILSLQRLSQNALGNGVNAGVGAPVVSPNSDKLVFASAASNLVLGDDGGGKFDIFLQDFAAGTIQRISQGPLGGDSNGDSLSPSISIDTPNAFFAIAFESDASDISKRRAQFPDTNNARDIYLSIPKRNNFLERISVGNGAVQADGPSSQASVTLLPTSRLILVAYASAATNLVSNDTNGRVDIFLSKVTTPVGEVFDPTTDITTERITMGFDGQQTNAHSLNPVITQDGRFIVFESDATNLVEGANPTARQLYLYNIETGKTSLVSRDENGAPGNDLSRSPAANFNGKFIAYATRATNIISDGFVPAGDYLQIMLFNTQSGKTQRVNTAEDGTPGNGTVGSNVQAAVSPDGRLVLFSDTASNLVSNDTNNVSDIFIKDLATGKVTRLSTGPNSAEANAGSLFPSFARSTFNSDFGRAIFASAADNLIANDENTRNDIFLSTITIPKIPFKRDTKIEVPPDAVFDSSTDKLAVTLQEFDGFDLSRNKKNKATVLPARKTRTTLRYLIDVKQLDVAKKKADRRKIFSKRNELTINKLKPGNYSMRYQTQIKRGDKIVDKSPFSPTLFFTTLDE